MPDLESYRKLAPFSAKELLEAANSLLRDKPELALTERTLRYYVSEGLLPSPEGPTKFARYSFNHLVGLGAIRLLQDHGISLDRIRDELRSLFQPDNTSALALITDKLSAWLSRRERMPAADLTGELFPPSSLPDFVAESRTAAAPAAPSGKSSTDARRYGYMRGHAPASRQELAATVEALQDELALVRREMDMHRHITLEARSERSLEPQIGELRSVMGELADAVRMLQREVLGLRQQVEAQNPATKKAAAEDSPRHRD